MRGCVRVYEGVYERICERVCMRGCMRGSVTPGVPGCCGIGEVC